MSGNLNLEACIGANICIQTYMSGPECGSEVRHLPPFALAEDLCLNALRSRLDQEANAPRIKDWRGRALKDLALGWHEAEIGLHPLTPDRPPEAEPQTSRGKMLYAEDHFSRAASYASEVLQNRRRLFSDGVSAAQLSLYLPVLPLRRKGGAWSAEDFRRIRLGVGLFVESTRGATLHLPPTDGQTGHPYSSKASKHSPCFLQESDRLKTLTQLGGQLLVLRAGLPVTPSSVREASGDYQTGHHRFYIPGEASKLPLRFGFAPQGEGKRMEVFNRTGLYVAFAGLAKLAGESLSLRWRDLSSLTGRAITALSQEAQLLTISSVDQHLLDGMTSLLLSKVRECSQNPDHPFVMKPRGLAFPA